MRSEKGQFLPGTHWRPPKPFWERAWLYEEYVTKGRAANAIAKDFEVTEEAILFWLRKHGIPARSMTEIRSVKHWGAEGEANPMFGKRGAEAPSWKGGVTPERQAFYSSREWATAVKQVWKRDKAKCQRCRKTAPKIGRGHHIHHRIAFGVTEIRANLGNLVLLCRTCHHFVHSLKNTSREFLGNAQLQLEGGNATRGEG